MKEVSLEERIYEKYAKHNSTIWTWFKSKMVQETKFRLK